MVCSEGFAELKLDKFEMSFGWLTLLMLNKSFPLGYYNLFNSYLCEDERTWRMQAGVDETRFQPQVRADAFDECHNFWTMPVPPKKFSKLPFPHLFQNIRFPTSTSPISEIRKPPCITFEHKITQFQPKNS